MIDTHTHIYLPEFDNDRDDVVLRAANAGIHSLILPNIDVSTVDALHETTERYRGRCHAAMGLHPTSVEDDYPEQLSRIKALLESRRYCAIGEIGIDLYWDKSRLQEQKEVFARQTEWAAEWSMPVIIHCREALDEVLEVLERLGKGCVTGVFHSFTSGVAEVENRRVMQSVIKGTMLRKYGYVQVHRDSPDERGIDVALVYREDVFRKLDWRCLAVDRDAEGRGMKTRDILYVCLERPENGERYHFLVNHHPSRYGGEKLSGPGRMAAMKVMVSVCDSLLEKGERNIVCMGDFNDTPSGTAFGLAEGVLVNMAAPLAEKGEGTVRYGGKWELIDMFLVDRGLASEAEMKICFPGFLSVRDNVHPGLKPLRTYTGPAYTGGISDHLPVVLLL